MVEAFLAAATGGDVGGLMAVLAEDVTFVSDGGGVAATPRRAIVGQDQVARVFLQGAMREQAAATVTRLVFVNGCPGLVAYRGSAPRAAVAFEIDAGRIRTIYLIANPEKLQRLPAATPPGPHPIGR